MVTGEKILSPLKFTAVTLNEIDLLKLVLNVVGVTELFVKVTDAKPFVGIGLVVQLDKFGSFTVPVTPWPNVYFNKLDMKKFLNKFVIVEVTEKVGIV
jgi:hypothetical protein